MGVCNCSMFCCTLLYVHFSIAIILMGKRELIALLNLSSWCLVMVERLFLTVPRGCLQFVIVVFPDHTHLLFFTRCMKCKIECVCQPKQIEKSQSLKKRRTHWSEETEKQPHKTGCGRKNVQTFNLNRLAQYEMWKINSKILE